MTLKIQSLGEQVFEVLKEKIVNNEYKPGELLQIEKLADALGVSTTPVREALLRLEHMGLVSIERNKAAFVTQISKELAEYTWEFRKLLEAYVSRDAAIYCSNEELENIQSLLLRVIDNPSNFDLYKESDISLHSLLSKYTKNYLIINALASISLNARRIRYYAEDIPFPEKVVILVTHEHLAIVEALKSRDPDFTEQKVREHLDNAKKRTLSSPYFTQ